MNAIRLRRRTPLLLALLAAMTLAGVTVAGAAAPWHSTGKKPPPATKAPAFYPPERRHELYREERFIRLLYQGFLARTPSREEVRHWKREMEQGGDPTELVRSFMESDEYFVRQVFLGLLGREPDSSGRETYNRALQRGASRSEVIESVVWSEEFQRQRMR